MSAIRCAIHDKDEPTEGAFRICFECKHVFKTAQEVIDEHKEAIDRMLVEDRVYVSDPEILAADFCPLCIHDWVFPPLDNS